jgi:hypothetical protein
MPNVASPILKPNRDEYCSGMTITLHIRRIFRTDLRSAYVDRLTRFEVPRDTIQYPLASKNKLYERHVLKKACHERCVQLIIFFLIEIEGFGSQNDMSLLSSLSRNINTKGIPDILARLMNISRNRSHIASITTHAVSPPALACGT